jgi:hypothetical protein
LVDKFDLKTNIIYLAEHIPLTLCLLATNAQDEGVPSNVIILTPAINVELPTTTAATSKIRKERQTPILYSLF